MRLLYVTPLLAASAYATPFWFYPLVDSRALQRNINRAGLKRHVDKLQSFAKNDPEGNRSFGGKGHIATVEYIKKWFAQWPHYYKVETQDFVELYSAGDSTLVVEGETIDSQYFTYAPKGDLEAELAVTNNLGCELSDYPPEVKGRIALISRGTCEFGLKAALAGASGAVGAIIYNNAPGAVGGGTLGSPERPDGPYVPVTSISLEDGQALVADTQAGPVIARLNVNSIVENRTTTNVFATTRGGNQNSVVQLGGHTDSIVGPGINDDGSGVMAQLEVAKYLTKFKVNNAVRFSFWSAEEFGLLGSEYYIRNLPDAEKDKIRLYLNFDMIASPNYVYMVYDGDGSAFNQTAPAPPGSAQIEKVFNDFYYSIGSKPTPTEFSGRSDYGPFLEVGIPAGGIFTGAEGVKTEEEAAYYGGTAGEWYDPNYHKKGDDFKNLDWDAFVTNTKAVAHSLAYYARSVKEIPKRVAPTVTKRQEAHAAHDHTVGTCGHKLQLS